MKATVLHIRLCAAADEPAATTVPAPSLPTGIDLPMRFLTAPMNLAGTSALMTGRSALPDCLAVVMSATLNITPRSDRSEERRVGKEWRSRWSAHREKKKE